MENELTIEYAALKKELTDYYLREFSSPSACYTLAVYPDEVEVIKKLICIVGGREACEAMAHCWNVARKEYPKMMLVTQIGWPTSRSAWNRRVERK